jgi:hypothetical protein
VKKTRNAAKSTKIDMSALTAHASALVRLFRALARLSPDCARVLELAHDQQAAAPILSRLVAGEDPALLDLRHGVAAVHALLRDLASETGPLLAGASAGSIEEMKAWLEGRPPGLRRLASILLLWASRLADHSTVNGATIEALTESFVGVLIGEGAAQRGALGALIRHAEALTAEATPKAIALAELAAVEAQVEDIRSMAATVNNLEHAALLARRLRKARLRLDQPMPTTGNTTTTQA